MLAADDIVAVCLFSFVSVFYSFINFAGTPDGPSRSRCVFFLWQEMYFVFSDCRDY